MDRTTDGDGNESSEFATLTKVATGIRESVESVIEGKPDVVKLALTVMLAQGHLLIEDVPGVGKTMLSKALARSIDCTVKRIQFTPDLLPSDVTGVSVYNQETRQFEFRPGGVFANVVVGDEINRASPKTQAALLECMEERQVTSDGVTYVLERPFMVIATQNPIEMEGTYPLPEAQRDRFMARVSMGYPVESAELAMLNSRSGANPLDNVQPVTNATEVARLAEVVSTVFVTDAVKQYAVALTTATRRSPDLRRRAPPPAPRPPRPAARGAPPPPPSDARARPPGAAQHRGAPGRPLRGPDPARPRRPGAHAPGPWRRDARTVTRCAASWMR